MNSLSGASLKGVSLGWYVGLDWGWGDPEEEEESEEEECDPGYEMNSSGDCQKIAVSKPASAPPSGGGSSYKPPASTPVTAPPPAPVESEFPWKWVVAGLLAVGAVGIVVAKNMD